jgi:hypothetical protein
VQHRGGMSTDHATLRPGGRLPPVDLVGLPGDVRRNLRRESRDATVLILPVPGHATPGGDPGTDAGDDAGTDAGAWRRYLEQVAAAAPEIQEWYARILVVVAERDAGLRLHAALAGRLPVLADPERTLARGLALPPGAGALVIADRYGQVYDARTAAAPAGLPGPTEIEAWVRFLSTQCPECGVIDEPGHGEYALD